MTEKFKKSVKDPRWIIEGLIWGTIMWIFMTFIVPLVRNQPIGKAEIIEGTITWFIGGLFFGFVMNVWPGIPASFKRDSSDN